MRKLLLSFVATAAASAIALAPTPARANGRFPESNAFFFSPTDKNLVLQRVTFGLLISHDRGGTWDWVCETSVGLTGSEDPMYTFTPKGTLMGSTFSGFTVSSDRACNFAFAKGNVNELVFVDLASREATPEKVIAFASSYAGQDPDLNPFYESNLWETSDEGQTFTRLNPVTLDKTLLGETVEVAPSDDQRIYVTAVRNAGMVNREGFLLVSLDHGKTFESRSVPLINDEKAPFISAVHPTNPDKIYVRTSNATDRPSRLLLSEDAGKTYRAVFTGTGPLQGLAFSPDHSKVWVGGPLDGLHVASTTDYAFTKKSSISIQCLSYQSDGLWACSNEKGGFIAGVTVDDGATFAPKLHLCGIRGALACPSGSTTELECVQGGRNAQRAQTWPAQNARLGCVPDGTDGGVDGGDAEAGTPVNPNVDPGGGCTLSAPSPSRVTPIAAAVAAAIAGLALLRRRRR